MTDPETIINKLVDLLKQDPGVVNMVDAQPELILAESRVVQNQWAAVVLEMSSPSIVVGYHGHKPGERDGEFHIHMFRVIYRNDTKPVTGFTDAVTNAQDYSTTPDPTPLLYTQLTPFTTAMGMSKSERRSLGMGNGDVMEIMLQVGDRKDEYLEST